MRQRWIIGNWKMYKTAKEAKEFVLGLASHVEKGWPHVGLAVPYTAIATASLAAGKSSVMIGAQNMNDHEEGAFTGEISPKMLKEAGAVFVILGHSERRKLFYETSAYVNRKVRRALLEGFRSIICFGENQEQRDNGQTTAILKRQLDDSLAGLTPQHFSSITLAYEPVWAIGTGQTATPEIAQEAHHFIRNYLQEKWGSETASKVAILYGGSVKEGTMTQMMSMPDIDGALVGGASLVLNTFLEIIKETKK